MTWNEYLTASERMLQEVGIEDSRTNVEYLAAKVFGFKERRDIRKGLKLEVLKKEAEQFDRLLQRRIAREPLQYILGEWEFYGIPILLNANVLIPRPETEILVEQAIAEAKRFSEAISILDIGSGSGCIAIAIATQLPNAHIIGIDDCSAAVQLACTNADLNSDILDCDKITFRIDNIFDSTWEASEEKFDVLVSNPPYISIEEFNSLEPELRCYEPRMALTDEEDGLRFYKRISFLSQRLLKKKGKLLMEIGFGMAEAVTEIVKDSGFEILRIENDLAGIPRVIVAEVVEP